MRARVRVEWTKHIKHTLHTTQRQFTLFLLPFLFASARTLSTEQMRIKKAIVVDIFFRLFYCNLIGFEGCLIRSLDKLPRNSIENTQMFGHQFILLYYDMKLVYEQEHSMCPNDSIFFLLSCVLISSHFSRFFSCHKQKINGCTMYTYASMSDGFWIYARCILYTWCVRTYVFYMLCPSLGCSFITFISRLRLLMINLCDVYTYKFVWECRASINSISKLQPPKNCDGNWR